MVWFSQIIFILSSAGLCMRANKKSYSHPVQKLSRNIWVCSRLSGKNYPRRGGKLSTNAGLEETYLRRVKECIEFAYLLPSAGPCWTILEWTGAKEQTTRWFSSNTLIQRSGDGVTKAGGGNTVRRPHAFLQKILGSNWLHKPAPNWRQTGGQFEDTKQQKKFLLSHKTSIFHRSWLINKTILVFSRLLVINSNL